MENSIEQNPKGSMENSEERFYNTEKMIISSFSSVTDIANKLYAFSQFAGKINNFAETGSYCISPKWIEGNQISHLVIARYTLLLFYEGAEQWDIAESEVNVTATPLLDKISERLYLEVSSNWKDSSGKFRQNNFILDETDYALFEGTTVFEKDIFIKGIINSKNQKRREFFDKFGIRIRFITALEYEKMPIGAVGTRRLYHSVPDIDIGAALVNSYYCGERSEETDIMTAHTHGFFENIDPVSVELTQRFAKEFPEIAQKHPWYFPQGMNSIGDIDSLATFGGKVDRLLRESVEARREAAEDVKQKEVDVIESIQAVVSIAHSPSSGRQEYRGTGILDTRSMSETEKSELAELNEAALPLQKKIGRQEYDKVTKQEKDAAFEHGRKIIPHVKISNPGENNLPEGVGLIEQK
jgi:hypothetical protein